MLSSIFQGLRNSESVLLYVHIILFLLFLLHYKFSLMSRKHELWYMRYIRLWNCISWVLSWAHTNLLIYCTCWNASRFSWGINVLPKYLNSYRIRVQIWTLFKMYDYIFNNIICGEKNRYMDMNKYFINIFNTNKSWYSYISGWIIYRN